MQARRKIDNKKKFTDSQIAAWLWSQEKEVHIQVRKLAAIALPQRDHCQTGMD